MSINGITSEFTPQLWQHALFVHEPVAGHDARRQVSTQGTHVLLPGTLVVRSPRQQRVVTR